MAHKHNSTTSEPEPQWSAVDKAALPRVAYADMGDPDKKSTWRYPHHWIKGGTKKDDDGIWVDGEMYLHRGGLNAAWAAAMGARSGEKASEDVIEHLCRHRRALGIDKEAETVVEEYRMVNPLPHLSSRIFNTPLMMDAGKLQTILGVYAQKLGMRLNGLSGAEPIYLAQSRSSTRIRAGNIAVVPIYGSLVYRSMGLHPESGMRSYQSIREDFRQALEDDSVGILLDIDSPGGEVSGLFDLVDDIFNARGTKPIYAIANEMALSAAYAIASAANQVFVPRTGWVGSIGVIAVHVDQSGFDHNVGIRYEPITAGAYKAALDPHRNLLSTEARQWLQNAVDETYAMFVDTVARNRGLRTDAVRGTEAGIFQGLNAVQVGLADAVMSVAQVISKLEKNRGGKMKAVGPMEAPILEPEAAEERHEATTPDETVSTVDLACALAMERDRVLNILTMSQAVPIPRAVLEQIIRSGMDCEEAKKEMLEAAANAQITNNMVVSASDPTVFGSANPLIAEAERRAREWNNMKRKREA